VSDETRPSQQRPHSAGTVAWNTVANLLTQGFLVVLAVGCMPFLVRSLGDDTFGLLTLVWTFVGYFSLLDFGVSRAITKFLADALALGQLEQARRITWGSLLFSVIVGSIASATIVLLSPWLVRDLLAVSPSRELDALSAFRIAAVGIPFTLAFSVIRGVQMAAQRFTLVNVGNGLLGVTQWLGAVVIVWGGGSLVQIVVLTVVSRIAVSTLMFLTLPRVVQGLFRSFQVWDADLKRRLIPFGGWVTVSQVVAPLFLYLDRFLIGFFLSLGAVAYYVVPQEALLRLLIIPMSLTTTLFPALSQASATEEGEDRLKLYYVRSLRYLAIVLIPLSMALVVFAPDILRVWVGQSYADQSSTVFRILGFGLFFCSLAQVPATALQAVGRPDLPAKFHLMELPLLVGLNVALIPLFGIVGAALVWTVRVIVDAALLFAGLRRLPGGAALNTWEVLTVVPLGPTMLLVASFLVAHYAPWGTIGALVICGSALIAYCVLIWRHSLDGRDRRFLFSLLNRSTGNS
jgi:O-antigen/teichoic acid export membrane protein